MKLLKSPKNEHHIVFFLNGLAMLANAILDNNYTTSNKDITALFNTALINLNKRGGYNYCVWETLEGYVDRYQEQIKKQIAFINPDEIVCCGESVYKLVKDYHLADDRVVRCAFHPSYFSVSDIGKLHFLKTGEKPNNTKENTIDVVNTEHARQGRIIDTNNYGGDENEIEMMNYSRACVYGDSRSQIGIFNKNDYALFYSSNKKGIVAIGVVDELHEDDKTDTAWWTVNPIVPVDFKTALKNRVALSIKETSKIVFDNESSRLVMVGTIKKKYIEEKKSA